MIVSEQINLNSLYEKSISKNKTISFLIHVCQPFLSYQALPSHCVREITGSIWKHHLLAFTSWFFCLRSLSLILCKEVVFQKYFSVANLTISSWLGFAALGCAHSVPVPTGTSSVTVA